MKLILLLSLFHAVAASAAKPLPGPASLWVDTQALTQAQSVRQAWLAGKSDRVRANQAKASLKTALLRLPGSALARPMQRELALLEILAPAESPPALEQERGFQRLLNLSALGLTPVKGLELYGKNCRKKCDPAWLKRLASAFPKNSPAGAYLNTHFSEQISATSFAEFPARAVATYKSPDLDFKAFDDAWALFRADEKRDALTQLGALVENYPKSILRPRALFWQARIRELREEKEPSLAGYRELTKASPLTFYGLYASYLAGEPLALPPEETAPSDALAGELPEDPTLQPHELVRLRKAGLLLKAKEPELACHEVADLRPREGSKTGFLLALAPRLAAAQCYSALFPTLSELLSRGYENGYTRGFMRMIFPMPFQREFDAASTEAAVEKAVFMALVKQESSFDLDAYSSAGAMGLTQLLYSTALDRDAKLERLTLVENGAINLKVGATYLKKMITRYNGNLPLALAAYNAGATQVDRWRVSAYPDTLTFVESIPFRETREYVFAILRNAYWYASFLGEPNPARFLATLKDPLP